MPADARTLTDLYCGVGLLGITVPTAYGGSEMDAVAAVLVHEELAASDPAFCLSYLAHSMLFVNNLTQNGSEEQKMKYLPDVKTKVIFGENASPSPRSPPHEGSGAGEMARWP